MIVYGSKITGNIALPLDLPVEGGSRYEIELASGVPLELAERTSCCSPFYLAHGRSVDLCSDREFGESEPGRPWCYDVKDVVRFFWYGDQRTIYCELGDSGTAGLLGFWFIHLVLPLYYTLETMYDFIHASAVEVEGKPVLFIAPSMGGKSTLTDYFIHQGHTLVSDDKVATFTENGQFMAVGSHPYHRPYRKHEELGYRVDKFAASPKPIHAIYLLHRDRPASNASIEEIKGFEKFDALMPNYLYTFSFLRAQRLRYLSSLLNTIRVFTISVPWHRERLPDVHTAICEHSKTI